MERDLQTCSDHWEIQETEFVWVLIGYDKAIFNFSWVSNTLIFCLDEIPVQNDFVEQLELDSPIWTEGNACKKLKNIKILHKLGISGNYNLNQVLQTSLKMDRIIELTLSREVRCRHKPGIFANLIFENLKNLHLDNIQLNLVDWSAIVKNCPLMKDIFAWTIIALVFVVNCYSGQNLRTLALGCGLFDPAIFGTLNVNLASHLQDLVSSRVWMILAWLIDFFIRRIDERNSWNSKFHSIQSFLKMLF